MIGRVTYYQIRDAVDRWLLDRVIQEQGPNVSQIARRLRVGRPKVRKCWARVRDLCGNEWSASQSQPLPAPPPPSLTAVFERGGDYAAIHAVLERWMIGAALSHTQDNVLQAAQRLGMDRSRLRVRWARLRGLLDSESEIFNS